MSEQVERQERWPIKLTQVKVHCVRCGNDFEIDYAHDEPLPQEDKDEVFTFCPFCHPSVRRPYSSLGEVRERTCSSLRRT